MHSVSYFKNLTDNRGFGCKKIVLGECYTIERLIIPFFFFLGSIFHNKGLPTTS